MCLKKKIFYWGYVGGRDEDNDIFMIWLEGSFRFKIVFYVICIRMGKEYGKRERLLVGYWI